MLANYVKLKIVKGVIMEKINFELEKELKNGNFSNVNLGKWFENYQYEYIYSTIQGCDKVINNSVLEFIVIYAELLMANPNVNPKNDADDIKWNCEYLLSQAVLVACRHFEEYKYVIRHLFNSESELVRLYCNANCPLSFSNTDGHMITDRIQKIRDIRREFYYCWNEGLFSEITKKRILFLAKALELKAIECYAFNRFEEFSSLIISSLLFENNINHISRFDMDVLYAIDDKKIFCYCLNKMLEDECLTFKEDSYLPSNLFFHTDYRTNLEKIKIKRPNSITVFNQIYTK